MWRSISIHAGWEKFKLCYITVDFATATSPRNVVCIKHVSYNDLVFQLLVIKDESNKN
jgi:hypothetical protein